MVSNVMVTLYFMITLLYVNIAFTPLLLWIDITIIITLLRHTPLADMLLLLLLFDADAAVSLMP